MFSVIIRKSLKGRRRRRSLKKSRCAVSNFLLIPSITVINIHKKEQNSPQDWRWTECSHPSWYPSVFQSLNSHKHHFSHWLSALWRCKSSRLQKLKFSSFFEFFWNFFIEFLRKLLKLWILRCHDYRAKLFYQFFVFFSQAHT